MNGDGFAEGSVGGFDDGGEPGEPFDPPETITCVDCGGTCHLLSGPSVQVDPAGDQVGFRRGDIVIYRCEDCLDRWDVEL